MLEMFTWLDVAIAVALLIAMALGIRAGLLRGLFSMIGIAGGLLAATAFYRPLSLFALEYLPLPTAALEFMSFVIIFTLIATLSSLAGTLLSSLTRIELIKSADHIGGSATGLLAGLILIGAFLIFLTIFPLATGFGELVEESLVADIILSTTEALYQGLAEILPFDLPLLSAYEEEINHLLSGMLIRDKVLEHEGIDFATLDGTGCFVCGEAVVFDGILLNSAGSRSPKFTCNNCGRTSDGCQTYEGYHAMYGICPVVLGNDGYRLDCGVWTNYDYQAAVGPCPVCGVE